jgi:hypothetical protein
MRGKGVTVHNGRSDETGMAIIVALFMVLVLSVLGASLVFVARTETLSSLNYRTMSESRYAAESAIHRAANHLAWTYTAPSAGSATDPLAAYDLTTSPVRLLANGRPVRLSSDAAEAWNYPDNAVQAAFAAAAQGLLDVTVGTNAFTASSIMYSAQATLRSMKPFVDSISGQSTALQTWEIRGFGRVAGAGSAAVEVVAVLERPMVPIYKYAAFATAETCGALDFAGGATTDSYDSGNALVGGYPALDQYAGNVGTNGGLAASGNPTTIYGTLSSPRTGVGSCSVGNMTAFDSNGGASVEDGMITLPQVVNFPTPPAISPPTTGWATGDCGSTAHCTPVGGDARFTPPAGTTVQLGNVDVGNGDVLYLNAGVYEINSLGGKGDIVVESGPVIVKIAGQGTSTPIDLTAGVVMNGSFIAANLQLIYGGTGEIKLRGNGKFSAVVYAPNAEADFAGNGDFYGALVAKKVKATGGSGIHYDRALDKSGWTVGNPVLSAFTWKSY